MNYLRVYAGPTCIPKAELAKSEQKILTRMLTDQLREDESPHYEHQQAHPSEAHKDDNELFAGLCKSHLHPYDQDSEE